MKLEFTVLAVSGYGAPCGSADFTVEGRKIKVEFTDGEAAEIVAIAYRAYERDKHEFANAILSAQPALLMPPQTIDAKWDEVPSYANDVPF